MRVKTGDVVSVMSGDVTLSAVAAVSNSCNPGGVIIPNVSDDAGVMALANGDGSIAWVLVKR